MESKIQHDTAYQKQLETLIVWSEGENYDLALSFQEKAGCDEIWEKICQVRTHETFHIFTILDSLVEEMYALDTNTYAQCTKQGKIVQ